jgi:hypothetical protein
MGMYTEIYINIDLKPETPDHVIDTLYAVCRGDRSSPYLKDKPVRWSSLFHMSAYFTDTTLSELRYNNSAWVDKPYYTLHGKGAIKNYGGEIEQFFEWVKPWSNTNFMGYHMYEECTRPTLMYVEEPTQDFEY